MELHDKIVIATIAELTLIDRRRHRFVVNEKLWGKEVADAARFAEQARNGKEMSRMAGLRTTQVVTNNVGEDTLQDNLRVGRGNERPCA